ncbi:UNVERIFIED_ORG: hypothetical protein GGE63_002841 [Rhizobium esperanzae]
MESLANSAPGDDVIWLWIGSHASYDTLLK